MYATANKKMLNMLILEILQEYSDEAHPLTQQEIIRILKRTYGMECDRRSVRNNVDYLRDLGFDIVSDGGYYLATRQFEDSELRLLIDGVLCSKNITARQAKGLIQKLIACGNNYFSPKVSHVHSLAELRKADNKQLMYVIDKLNDAIDAKRKVALYYNTYGTDFKLHKKRPEKDVINPYQMVTANGFYYLIGNFDKYDDVAHLRLDKITGIEILDEKVKPARQVEGLEHGLNLPKHMAEHIYMFSGESSAIKLSAPTFMMNELIDWFGKDFRILEQDDDEMTIRVLCNERAFLYWALQYGAHVEVLEPAALREQVKGAVAEMARKYGVKA